MKSKEKKMATNTPASVSLKGSPGKALIGATIGFFIGFGAVSLFGPTAQGFIKVMQLTPREVGFLVAIPMLTGSLLRIPFGAWVDRNGGKLPLLILLIVSVVGITGLYWMLLTLYPKHLTQAAYPWLLFFGALGGCGIATFSVGIGQVSYWYPKARQGRALAVYAGLGNTSPGLVAIILPLIIATGGLWMGYLVSLVIVVGGIILYFVIGFNAPYFQLRHHGVAPAEAKRIATQHGQELFPAENVLRTLKDSAVSWRTWPLVVLYFTTFGGFLALTAWLPNFWLTFYQTPHVVAIGLTAGFSLFASLIRVPGGSWSDRFGGEIVAAASLFVLLVGAIIMTMSDRFAITVLGELLVGAGMGVNNAAVFKLVPLYVPNAVGGTAGWVGGLGALGGFVVPPLLGGIAQSMGQIGYARGYVIFVALALISLAFTALLYLTRKGVAH
ncbi:putative major facilitator superfamily transporter [Thiomonas sp. X19]|uniref:MFS transporter n=1 Tax=Thiomonas sp. X19 TaxID=1050370 RepID=UPI000B6A1FE4|nr:MFS transporter [Thiomonas sp. X19]SCC95673.1 putative major facilitator superfamily transporter [Thiomonas sp. X19]